MKTKAQLNQAVILAGGLATRLRPMTETMPKALVDINGEPFIIHQLRLLKKNHIHQIVLCVGYLGEMIQDVIGDGSQLGMQIEYSFDGDVLLGTAGAICQALPYLKAQFFVVYGDSYLPCDYQAAYQHYLNTQQLALMTVFNNEGKWDSSNVQFDPKNQSILVYDKKIRTPKMHYIDYGLGIFNKKVFADLPKKIPIDLADVYQHLLSKQQLAAFEIKQRFYEAGSFAGITELSYYLQNSKELACNL